MCISCVNFCKRACEDIDEESIDESLPTVSGVARQVLVHPQNNPAPMTARSIQNLSPIPETGNSSLSKLPNADGTYLTPRITPRSFNVAAAPAEPEVLVAESISSEKQD